MRRKTEHGTEDVLDGERRRLEPETGTRVLASAIGNRALSNLITTGSLSRKPLGREGPAATRVIARDDPDPPLPVKPDPPAVKKVDFPEADKERARRMVVGPLRAVAEKLAVGEKADIAWVLRHLKPIPTAARPRKRMPTSSPRLIASPTPSCRGHRSPFDRAVHAEPASRSSGRRH